MANADEWLMSQVKQGSSQALEPLIRRHAAALLTFTTRLLGNRGGEAFQDLWLAIWAHRHTYTYPRPFRAWCFRIAANKCHELMRRRPQAAGAAGGGGCWGERGAQEIPTEAFAGTSAGEAAVANQTATLVEQAVNRLTAQQRTILVMHIWNGMPCGEIADALEMEPPTVRSMMHDALASLRRFLEPRLG